MKKIAKAKVEEKKPGNNNFKIGDFHENCLGGTLIDITFRISKVNRPAIPAPYATSCFYVF